MHAAAIVLLLGVGAAFALPLLGRGESAPTPTTLIAPTTIPEGMSPATTATATKDATPPNEAPAIAFPDGSRQPLLNGAADAVSIDWPTNRPFAPIRGRIVHHGTEFYEHTDGTYTTSIVRQDQVSGKQLTIGLIYTPEARAVEPRLSGDPERR